jgi:hypothetical protein
MRTGDIVLYNVGGSREMGLILDRHRNNRYKKDAISRFQRMEELVLVQWFPYNTDGTQLRPEMYTNPRLMGDCWSPRDAPIGWVPVWSDLGVPTFKVISSGSSAYNGGHNERVA